MGIFEVNGNKVAIIERMNFCNKQKIPWDKVEQYLKKYVNQQYLVEATNDIIYIGKDFPDEYHASKYTQSLKGGLAKAKANAAAAIHEIVSVADKPRYNRNFEAKHTKDALYGWVRYNTRFAIPVSDNRGEYQYHNIYFATLIIRLDQDMKRYLYDLINIKKEASKPLSSGIRS